MQQQQHRNTNGGEATEMALLTVLFSLSFTLEACLHRRFGIRYIGVKGLMGCIILLGFQVLYPHDNHRPLLIFAAVYAALWIMAQLGTWYRRLRKRIDGHTRYSGRPFLLWVLPWCGELFIKWLEPILVLFAGYFVHRWNRPLGTYLLIAGSALLITATFSIAAARERVLDMNDAVAGGQVTAERFRRLQE